MVIFFLLAYFGSDQRPYFHGSMIYGTTCNRRVRILRSPGKKAGPIAAAMVLLTE